MTPSKVVALSLFLVVASGAFLTMGSVPVFGLEYLVEMLAIGALLGLTVCLLSKRLVQSIASWIVLALISSSYCLKLILIVMHPESPVTLGMLPRLGLHDPVIVDLWIGALRLTLIGVFAFCSVLGLAYFFSRTSEVPRVNDEDITLSPLAWYGCWALLAVLGIVTAWLSQHFGIGLMGAEIKIALPYHLRGIVFYFRSYVLIGALLLLAYFAWRQKQGVWFWLAVGLLLVNGVADALIRSSKAALLAPILYVCFLIVAAEIPVKRRYVGLALLAIVPIFLSIPYLNNFRVIRNGGLDMWPALIETVSATGLAPFDALIRGAIWVVYRLPGVEMLIGIIGHPTPPIGSHWAEVLTSANGVAGFLTSDVFLIPPEHPHLAAPSYFGWWYLVFGRPGVFVGGAILALVTKFMWELFLKLNCRTFVLVRVFFMMLLFSAFSEGALDALTKPFIAICITILLLESAMQLIPWFFRRNVSFAKR